MMCNEKEKDKRKTMENREMIVFRSDKELHNKEYPFLRALNSSFSEVNVNSMVWSRGAQQLISFKENNICYLGCP